MQMTTQGNQINQVAVVKLCYASWRIHLTGCIVILLKDLAKEILKLCWNGAACSYLHNLLLDSY